MRTTLLAALAATLIAGCGRVHYAQGRGAPDAMDARVAPADASADDASADDASADDASADDAASGPDAATPTGETELLVINTLASGPGSLEAAVATANTCMRPPYTIRFAIPREDPGRVSRGSNAYWRISAPSVLTISCAATTIDGATQTSNVGNDNSFAVNLTAGVASTPLPTIEGPEIDLRGIMLVVRGSDVTLRGLAMQAAVAAAPNAHIEQCFLGSEPDEAMAQPPADRHLDGGYAFYGESCTDCVVSSCVLAGGEDPSGASASLLSFRTGSLRATLRDSYLVGAIAPGNLWDVAHLMVAEDHRVLRNVFAATGYEYAVEWVPGYDGQIVDNTFFHYADLATAVSMGGAAVMSGNRFVP